MDCEAPSSLLRIEVAVPEARYLPISPATSVINAKLGMEAHHYCSVAYVPHDKDTDSTTHNTPSAGNGSNPAWPADSVFTFDIVDKSNDMLHVTVWHKRAIVGDEVVGTVVLPLSRIVEDFWYPLADSSGFISELNGSSATDNGTAVIPNTEFTVRAVYEMSEFAPSDWGRVVYSLYSHHFIILPEGKVVHFFGYVGDALKRTLLIDGIPRTVRSFVNATLLAGRIQMGLLRDIFLDARACGGRVEKVIVPDHLRRPDEKVLELAGLILAAEETAVNEAAKSAGISKEVVTTYNLFTSNCENLACWLKTGEWRSSQVTTVLSAKLGVEAHHYCSVAYVPWNKDTDSIALNTPAAADETNPRWDTDSVFTFNILDKSNDTLRVTVWHKRAIVGDEVVGTVVLPLSRIVEDCWYPLADSSGFISELNGSVHIRLQYKDPVPQAIPNTEFTVRVVYEMSEFVPADWGRLVYPRYWHNFIVLPEGQVLHWIWTVDYALKQTFLVDGVPKTVRSLFNFTCPACKIQKGMLRDLFLYSRSSGYRVEKVIVPDHLRHPDDEVLRLANRILMEEEAAINDAAKTARWSSGVSALALCGAYHSRLGAESPAHYASPYVLDSVLEFAFPAPRTAAVVVAGAFASGKATLRARLLEGGRRVSDDPLSASYSPERNTLMMFETKVGVFAVKQALGRRGVPMASPVDRADAVVVVVPAPRAEFDDCTDGRGSLRPSLDVAVATGAAHVVFAVNKMDAVEWSQERFEQASARLAKLAQSSGLRNDVRVSFVPLCAADGANVRSARRALCPWYRGPTLVGALEATEVSEVRRWPLAFQALTGGCCLGPPFARCQAVAEFDACVHIFNHIGSVSEGFRAAVVIGAVRQECRVSRLYATLDHRACVTRRNPSWLSSGIVACHVVLASPVSLDCDPDCLADFSLWYADTKVAFGCVVRFGAADALFQKQR
eukprot:m51a1_g13954 hypothetical protein (952) ;mRNA; f:931345-936324